MGGWYLVNKLQGSTTHLHAKSSYFWPSYPQGLVHSVLTWLVTVMCWCQTASELCNGSILQLFFSAKTVYEVQNNTGKSSLKFIWYFFIFCSGHLLFVACTFLENQVGMNRLPQFKDKPNMPYTEAFIYEVFRHASYMPFTIPHWWVHVSLFMLMLSL